MQTFKFGPYTVNWVPRTDWDIIGRQRGEYIGASKFHALVPHHAVVPYVEAYYELVIEKMRFLQVLRPDLGNDIPYNWVAFADPNPYNCWIAEGRGLGYTGAHTYGYNSVVHAVCFWGNSMVDPVNPGIFEGMRFCGRMMPNATDPTLDHGQYPDEGTSCAGFNVRSHLAELQPPFLTPGLIPVDNIAVKETRDVFDFKLRRAKTPAGIVVTDSFMWQEGKLKFGFPVSAYDSGVTRKDQTEVTVTLHGPDRRPVTVGLIEGNGYQHDAVLVQWGNPIAFNIQKASGWCTVLCATERIGDIAVQGQ